jgi:hypothetical protein
MTSVGRRRKTPTIAWRIYIPESLQLRFDTLYLNRARGKPIYGIRSQIVTDLLEAHVRQLEAQIATLNTPLSPTDYPPTQLEAHNGS